MADYFVDYNGNITKNKKKKKQPTYIVSTDGTITKNKISPQSSEVNDIAPVKTDENQKWYQGWLKKSEGNFGQTVKASSVDLAEDATIGVVGSGEKLLDSLMAFAPAMNNLNKINSGQMLDAEDWKEHDKQKKVSEEFIKKDLYDEAEVAKKIITTPFEKRTGIDVESMSVFDKKADSLAQSGGQMGVTALVSLANPMLGSAMLGGTSFGSEMENALNKGATYDEAMLSATITAGAEMLTEKISGGISLGGKTLDDLIPVDKLAQGISNKVVRNLINIGVDATGEGFEEIVSGVLSAVGQKMTYMEEKELKELFSSEEALESFLGGAILGGISSTGKTAIDTVKGKDSLSGLSKNEKAVFDKVYNDAIAEKEKDGKKLTQKEKNEIYDDTLKKLEKGYIDIDTIESVLGGETYKNLKTETENETKLKEEYDALNKMKIGEMTGEQTDRKAELKKQLDELKNTSKSADFRTQLDSEMLKAVKGTKLEESFNERSRRGQNLEVDVEAYKNESAKQTAQNFKDFGANNTNQAHDYLDLVTKVAEDRGHTFKFMTTKQLEESIANGNPYNIDVDANKVEAFVSKGTKEIIINMDANKSLNSLVGHEVMHTLEQANSYSDTQSVLFEYAKTKGEYDDRLASIKRRYSNLTEEQQLQELASDLVGDYVFGDTDFVRNLSTEKPNVFKKIYNEIKYLWKMATAGSKEARELERVKKEFEKIWQETNSTETNAEAEEVSDSDVKFSVREEAPPKETGIAYKVFYVKDGKLYPPMVANPDGADTPMGVWLNADVGTSAPPSKTGRQQVKAGGKGTQGGSGSLAFRPGWHLGDLPRASQFDRVNPETGAKELFPKDFVWAEVEYAKDVDYQEEAMSYGYTDNGKFRHAYAGLPKLPENGYYRYRTNPKPDTVPWIITGAMKVNRLLSDAEVNSILEDNGVQPVHRQGGDVGLDKFGFNEDGSVKYSIADDVSDFDSWLDGLSIDELISFMELDEISTNEETKANKKTKRRVDEVNKRLKKIGLTFNGTKQASWTDERIEKYLDGSHYGASHPDYAQAYISYVTPQQYLNLTVGGNTNTLDSIQNESESYGELDFDKLGNSSPISLYISENGNTAKVKGHEGRHRMYLLGKAGFEKVPVLIFNYDNKYEKTTKTNLKLTAQRFNDTDLISKSRDVILEEVIPFNNRNKDIIIEKFGSGNTKADVRYSIADNQGRKLTQEQQEYFKDSKVRDENGNLKVMYHGTPNGDYTVFREGTYFTDNKAYADVYQNQGASSNGYKKTANNPKTYEVYLDIKKPFDTRNPKEREIFENEYYRQWGMGTPLMESGLPDWMDGEDLIEFIQENGYDYDGLILDEGGVGGYGDEVKSRGLSYVVFNSEQVKNVDNTAPTENPDIRYALREEVENVSDRLSMSEWKQVQSAVADHTKRNYHYEKSADGDIIIPINNKLVYTDSNFDSVGVRKVVEFDSDYENEIDIARRFIYEAEKRKSEITDAYEISEDFVGHEFIIEYNQKDIGNVKGYDRRTSRGKSKSDSYHANFMQERIRRANEIINSVNSGKGSSQASSEDGVFFDAENEADNKTYRIADDEHYISKEYGNHIYAKDVVLDSDENIAPTTTDTTVEEMPIRSDYESEEDNRIVGEDLTKKNADKIRTIQAEIKGHYLTRDIAKKEFDDKIAKKESEYESLKRKDTKKAVDLLNQITNLETRRDSLLQSLDNKIERANKRIESIENESRFEKRKTKQKQYRELFGSLMGDTSTWKDKKLGIQYQTNTLRRNLRDIVRDASGNQDIAKADALYDELQGSVNRNEAKKNREANKVKDAFREMKINNTESTYIQMLGELRHNPDTTLTQDVVDDYYNKNKGKIDTQKVDKAIEEARKLYDSLYDRVNASLSEHGFKEIGYRKGYFPHFTDPKQNWLAKLLNWKVNNDEIPTDIAGITETFEPQRTWQSFDKHRTSDTTDYNFLKGLDNYVNGALDWIYHIEDIQKHRAFETEIRYRHSSEEVQKKIDEYRNNPMLSTEEADTLIQNALREAQNPLNNFVTDLHTRTNILAGKKSSKDRNMESDFNRHAYSIMTNITNRVTANQVVGSVSSALTNFIPITQSWGQVKPTSSLVGMKKTIQSYMSDDGVVAKSDFLTNRIAMNEALYKGFWDKASEIVGGLMEIVDNFTSQTIWRSKYYENIKNGMSEEQAIKNADQFAENVIGGRSKGNMPTIFHAKNPVSKMLTSFQLEVANQYGYMFKDMPQDIGKNAIGKLVKGWATIFVGAYAYNALYSSIVGRDVAFDPFGIIEDFIRDLVGDDDEEKDVAGAVGNLASNIADEIPFVGGLLGGGRIPISSALPYNASISDAYKDVTEGDWKSVMDEMSKPLYYGVLPMGGGQIRKTVQGLSMFNEKHPVSGSYTKSGALRFPVEDTFLNKLQAGVFGQYASKNAREYFDREQAPLKEKQIQEYIDVDLPISEYWDYREGLKGLTKLSDKADYINSLDLPIDKKNLLVNNQSDREEPIDLTGFNDDFENFEEFDFAVNNPEKYEVAEKVGGYKKYKRYQEGMKDMKLSEKADYIFDLNLTIEQKNALINGETDRKEPIDLTGYENFNSFEEFELAKENPKKYSASLVIGYDDFTRYMDEIGEIRADRDSNGKTINGSAKRKKTDYINSLDLDYGQRIILYRSLFDSESDKRMYNADIVEYLNNRDDISYEEMVTILESLDFKVYSDGTVKW